VALVAIGAQLGWLLGSGRLEFDRRSSAKPGSPGPLVARDKPAQKEAPGRKDDKKPNVVYALVDNLGFGELGCYGV
jgi:hypothetical protein